MHIEAETLDDLLHQVFTGLLRSRNRTESTKGPARELIGTLLTLTDPRARFSRTERRATLFSCLGETLWYLSGSDKLDVIEYYIPRYRTFAGLPQTAERATGAYGPRVAAPGNTNQIQAIIDLLQHKRDTRQAVIQIFDASDLRTASSDVPCTCTLQFFARAGLLHMVTHMRSNDAYLGLPHDVFAFTMIQELIARSISHELGVYHHSVGSLHLYEENERQARQYLDEGWQEKMAMPPMPRGDPWPSLSWLQEMEESVRLGRRETVAQAGVDPYWADLARILRTKVLLASGDKRAMVKEKTRCLLKYMMPSSGARKGAPGLNQPAHSFASQE
jgi:thymidylate synthase